jgi:hypothetical protein
MLNIEERRLFILKRTKDPLLGKKALKTTQLSFIRNYLEHPSKTYSLWLNLKLLIFLKFLHEDNDILTTDIKENEVYEAIMQMENNKALGPEGFHAELCQKFWDTIKVDLMNMLAKFQ